MINFAVNSQKDLLKWSALLPYAQVFLFLGLMCLPVNLIPHPLVWVYDKILWSSEPLWLAVEAAELVGLCMILSQKLQDKIDERPKVYKSTILMVSGCCYLGSVFLGLLVLSYGTFAAKWLILVLIAIGIFIHACSIYLDEGIISDASMVTMLMFGVLYAMTTETYSANHPIETPPDSKTSLHLSFFKLFFSVTSDKADHGSRAFQFLLKILSPTFLIMVVVRLYCMLSFMKNMVDWSNRDDRDDKNYVDIEDDCSPSLVPVQSPFIIRLAFIFVVTQVVTNHIHRMTADDTSWMSWYPEFLYKDIILGRVIQIGLMAALYLYQLYSSENNDEWWNK
ncbi:uncharacterized protein LOC135482633 isoform X2 [Lineus longissimus]|uniref:uncharacterized protein LOC135482633 isoform X2 n=1 Tax=Lineus longissimus TaxID=88925 RepID=UPI002B4D92DE